MQRLRVLIVILIFSQISLGTILTLVKEGGVELYDISIPLLPVRLGTVNVPNAIKSFSQGDSLYVLSPLKIDVFDSNLNLINSVEPDRRIIDAVMVAEDIYVLHDYSVTVFDKNLKLKAAYAINEKITKIDIYGDSLVALCDGKVIAFDKRMKRVWEVSAPDPIVAMQVVENKLMFSTKKEFYVMNLIGTVPVFEAKYKFTMDFQQMIPFRNGFVVLMKDRSILLLSMADFSVKDRLNISAVSIVSHRDYLYVVTDKGNVTIVGVLLNSLKLFQTFGAGVKLANMINLNLFQTASLPTQSTMSTTPKVQEEKKTEEVQKALTFLAEIKLSQRVNNSLALGNVFCANSLDGNLLRIDPKSLKVQSNKIAFILTADPVLLEDGSIVLGGWDKNIYIISDKTTSKISVESNISLPVARTSNGFVAVDDGGTLYFIDLNGTEPPRKVRLAAWFICPPAVHEEYGVVLLDWLGILRLVDFSGKEVWSLVTKAAKSGEIILAADTAFVITQDTIWSIDIKNGKIKWSQSFDGAELIQAVCDLKTLYICDNLGRIHALNFSGKTIWLKESLFAKSILLTEAGLLAAGEKLYLISTSDGSIIQQEDLPNPISGKLKLSPQGLLTVIIGDKLLVYKLNSLPASGWPMYLGDATNSSFFTKRSK